MNREEEDRWSKDEELADFLKHATDLVVGTVPEAIDDIFVDLKRERDLEP